MQLKEKEKECLANLKKGQYKSMACFNLMEKVISGSNGGVSGMGKVSMYDVRHYEATREFPPGHKIVEVRWVPWPGVDCSGLWGYLSKPEVREAIHASSFTDRFKECTDPPYEHLAKWDGLGVVDELRMVLTEGVRTLFYNGQFDLVCNHVSITHCSCP
ncbi:unnamed protein product [Discosporangium mesarthrocarpum]